MGLKRPRWWWRFRWLSWLYAYLFHYFWLPCPICGRQFGGHEWLPDHALMLSLHKGIAVCPNCGDEAKRRNSIVLKKLGVLIVPPSAPTEGGV
ncbi:MAG TPA: hypothetical protein VNA25_15815 [Phycisphaerae bacterium]|nr:hypothetical protein [Phycisphaerae bacterium]